MTFNSRAKKAIGLREKIARRSSFQGCATCAPKISGAVVSLLGATALTGCIGVQGMDQIVGLQGQPTETVSRTIFAKDFSEALNDRGQDLPAGQTAHATTHVRPMMRSGMMYIRSYCSDYFRRMAVEQRGSRIVRDALAPISALITGIAGVRDFGSSEASEDDYLTLLGLLTTTSSSALDIYDKHLLFGAENIDSVRTLTMKALETHKQAVLAAGPYEFEDGVEALIENQNICSPQAILSLTRKAIQAADPVPDDAAPVPPAPPPLAAPPPPPPVIAMPPVVAPAQSARVPIGTKIRS